MPVKNEKKKRPRDRKFVAVELTKVEIDLLKKCEGKHDHKNRSEFVRAALREYARKLLAWTE